VQRDTQRLRKGDAGAAEHAGDA